MLALVRDLMFSSKITAEAKTAGAAVKIIRDAAKLADEPGNVLFVDLQQENALDAAEAWKRADPSRSVVGFASHVETSTLARARAAGVDCVLTRGQFTQHLPNFFKAQQSEADQHAK